MAPVRNLPGALAISAIALAAAPAAASSDGIEIFPQIGPLIVLVVFFAVLIWPANQLLWRPLLRVFDERRERIAGTRARAEKIASEAEDVLSAYQASVERARLGAESERAKILEAARREQGQVNADARRSAEAEVAAAREAVGAAFERARSDLQGAARERLRGRGARAGEAPREARGALARGGRRRRAGSRARPCHGWRRGRRQLGAILEWLNLLLLVAALVYFGRKPIMSFLSERRSGIERDLQGADQLLRDAESRLAEWGDRAARLETEIADIKRVAREAAEQQAARILADARAVAERIARDAGRSSSARRSVPASGSARRPRSLAVRSAERVLTEQIQPADGDRLFDEFVTHIEQAPPPTSRS